MNSTRTAKIKSNTNRSTITVPLLLFVTLVATSGFVASPLAAQQADAPDTIETFPVEAGAWALVFDGANIWVDN